MKQFKSENIERIVNAQMQGLKPALLDFMANTSNNITIDYTHTIDISFEERRHEIIKSMSKIRKEKTFNIKNYNRMLKILKRTSSTKIIEYDLKAFMRKVRLKLEFDAFYLIPDINHTHMLLVVYDGDIKYFTRKAKNRPYCWNIKVNEFNSSVGEYLENKVKYLMSKNNFNLKQYEDIVYDFYPDRKRIDSFFEKHPSVYDCKLYETEKSLREKLSKRNCKKQLLTVT